jgi:hypothetical protein
MADLHKFSVQEALNTVLNTAEDALKVDIDNVTLKTEGSDINIEVHTDKAEDSMLMFSHTVKTGSGGTSYVPLVDSDGHLQVDALSSALPSGAATAANQSTIIGHVDGIETLLTAANVDHAAIEVLLTAIDADTDAIKTAVQVLDDWDDSNYANVNINLAGSDAPTGGGAESGALRVTLANDSTGVVSVDDGGGALTVDGTVTANLSATDNAVLDTIDAVLDTIKVDTEAVETATEASQAALEKMLYGTALAVTAVHGGSDHSLGATYEAFYIGVGGDISLDCATSGSNIVFKNVASGQLLPVRATVVNATNTTATNIVALKA